MQVAPLAVETSDVATEGQRDIAEHAEQDTRPRQEEHQSLARSAPVLGPGSKVEDLRRRLKELGTATYGTKQQLWERLMENEARVAAKEREKEYLEARSKELEQAGEPRPGRILAGPESPGELERAQHELTHIPAKRWCEYCQLGKGAAEPHKVLLESERSRGPPVLELDFCFFKSEADGGENLGVTLVIIDTETGMCRATALEDKAVTKYAIDFVVNFVKSLFVGRLILRSDNEPAAVALCEAAKARLPEQIVIETTPRYSSGSLGAVERAHRAVQGQARTLRYAVLANYGISLDPGSPGFTWMMRHSAWLLARYTVKAHGHTPYFLAFGANYCGELVPFMETVLFRHSLPSHRRLHGVQRFKADSLWAKAVWLGRREQNGEHILGTPNGIQFARTVRRLEPSRRHQIKVLQAMVGTPWAPATRSMGKKRREPPVAYGPQNMEVKKGDEVTQPAASAAEDAGLERSASSALPSGVTDAVGPDLGGPTGVTDATMEDLQNAGEEVMTRSADEAMLDAGGPESKHQRVCVTEGSMFEHDANEEDIPLLLADAVGADSITDQDEIEGAVPSGDCEDTHTLAKWRELDKLMEFGVFMPVPRAEARGKKILRTLWTI
eukprot:5953018-Amphidinium_carterae.1